MFSKNFGSYQIFDFTICDFRSRFRFLPNFRFFNQNFKFLQRQTILNSKCRFQFIAKAAGLTTPTNVTYQTIALKMRIVSTASRATRVSAKRNLKEMGSPVTKLFQLTNVPLDNIIVTRMPRVRMS